MSSEYVAAQNLNRYDRPLGLCWVIYGVIRLATALLLILFTNTATVMFGALLARVPDPFTMMNFFHGTYTLIVVLSATCGVLGIIAGLALLAGQAFGRTIALVAGFLSLSDIPLGVTLGVFTLVALLPQSARNASGSVSHD